MKKFMKKFLDKIRSFNQVKDSTPWDPEITPIYDPNVKVTPPKKNIVPQNSFTHKANVVKNKVEEFRINLLKIN